MTKDGATEMS